MVILFTVLTGSSIRKVLKSSRIWQMLALVLKIQPQQKHFRMLTCFLQTLQILEIVVHGTISLEPLQNIESLFS
jgi:hypothetical protein